MTVFQTRENPFHRVANKRRGIGREFSFLSNATELNDWKNIAQAIAVLRHFSPISLRFAAERFRHRVFDFPRKSRNKTCR
jgi:hypothetical protein